MIPQRGNRFPDFAKPASAGEGRSDKIMRKLMPNLMPMCRVQRIVLLATFVLVAPALSGCANFDPESLDIFGLGDKKKLPGDRRPVFPEGVPGVSQGIPKEYIKGNQPPADTALLPPEQAAPAAAAAPVEEEPKAKPEPKPKRKVAAKPKPVAAAPVQPVSQTPQQQPQAQQAPAGWPQGSTPPASPSGSTAAWPSPPPSGTFQR